MQVLEIIQPNDDKQQLNEIVFAPALLVGATFLGKFLLTALAASIGMQAIDSAVGSVKNWLDDMEIKNYKPTGKHIPDKTIITNGKNRYVYDAEKRSWGVQTKQDGKWKYSGTLKKNLTAENLKDAIKNKRLSFGSKVAVLRTMDAQFIEKQVAAGKVSTDVKTSFTKSGNFLSDVIAKEEAGVRKGSRGVWNKIKTGGKMIFSPRLFQMINIFMPVALVINCVRLKAWYKTKLNWQVEKGNALDPNNPIKGFPSPSGDPNKVYDQDDYDQDMRNLRTTTVNAAVAWMSMVGVNAIASGIFWIYAQRKGKLIDRGEKKGFTPAMKRFFTGVTPAKWVKFGLKWGSRGVAAGLVYSAFDRNFAEKLANALVDYLFAYDPFTATYSTAEDITEYLIKALGGPGYEQAMSQIGLGTTSADDVVKAKDNNPPKPYNSLKKSDFDKEIDNDPFWKTN
jgi:hypothetical protein